MYFIHKNRFSVVQCIMYFVTCFLKKNDNGNQINLLFTSTIVLVTIHVFQSHLYTPLQWFTHTHTNVCLVYETTLKHIWVPVAMTEKEHWCNNILISILFTMLVMCWTSSDNKNRKGKMEDKNSSSY